MQVVVVPTASDDGTQLVAVLVVDRATLSTSAPLLAESVTLPEYAPLIVTLPDAPGVYVTEHVALLEPAADREQLAAGANAPVPLEESATDPLGEAGVPLSVSVTVTAHVNGWPTFGETGWQSSVVLVERPVTTSRASPPLPPWTALPP